VHRQPLGDLANPPSQRIEGHFWEMGASAVGYSVKCARCGAMAKIAKRKKCFVGDKFKYVSRLIKCDKCRCVVGEYGKNGKFGAWYGAEIERI
jgi:hypothetical protein